MVTVYNYMYTCINMYYSYKKFELLINNFQMRSNLRNQDINSPVYTRI